MPAARRQQGKHVREREHGMFEMWPAARLRSSWDSSGDSARQMDSTQDIWIQARGGKFRQAAMFGRPAQLGGIEQLTLLGPQSGSCLHARRIPSKKRTVLGRPLAAPDEGNIFAISRQPVVIFPCHRSLHIHKAAQRV